MVELGFTKFQLKKSPGMNIVRSQWGRAYTRWAAFSLPIASVDVNIIDPTPLLSDSSSGFHMWITYAWGQKEGSFRELSRVSRRHCIPRRLGISSHCIKSRLFTRRNFSLCKVLNEFCVFFSCFLWSTLQVSDLKRITTCISLTVHLSFIKSSHSCGGLFMQVKVALCVPPVTHFTNMSPFPCIFPHFIEINARLIQFIKIPLEKPCGASQRPFKFLPGSNLKASVDIRIVFWPRWVCFLFSFFFLSLSRLEHV